MTIFHSFVMPEVMQEELLARFADVSNGNIDCEKKLLRTRGVKWFHDAVRLSESVDKDRLIYPWFSCVKGGRYHRSEDYVHIDLPKDKNILKFVVALSIVPDAGTIFFPDVEVDSFQDDPPVKNTDLFHRTRKTRKLVVSNHGIAHFQEFQQAGNGQLAEFHVGSDAHVAPPMPHLSERILLTCLAHPQ
jgi:hypothetical protein